LLKTPQLSPQLAAKAPVMDTRKLNPQQSFVIKTYRDYRDKAKAAPSSANANAGSLTSQQSLHKMAVNFYQLHSDLKERGRLYELDTGAEVVLSPREMSRRAAARAGLQLPEEYTSK
jgi:hypothetical protein